MTREGRDAGTHQSRRLAQLPLRNREAFGPRGSNDPIIDIDVRGGSAG